MSSKKGAVAEFLGIVNTVHGFDNARRAAGESWQSAFTGLMGWFVGLGLGGVGGGILGMSLGAKISSALRNRLERLQEDPDSVEALSKFSDWVLDRADNTFEERHGRFPRDNEFYEPEYLQLCAEIATQQAAKQGLLQPSEDHASEALNPLGDEDAENAVAEDNVSECEYCGAEFGTFEEAEAHEGVCEERPDSDEDEDDSEEEDCDADEDEEEEWDFEDDEDTGC